MFFCFLDLIEDTGNGLPGTEASRAGESSEKDSLNETVAEDSTKPDLPSTSGELPENDTVSEGTTNDVIAERTSESAVSIEEEVADIRDESSKEENKLPSHSQKEAVVDANNKELEDNEANLNVDTSETLNTVEHDSTTCAIQDKFDNDAETKNETNESEISSVVENQVINENQKLVDVSSKTADAKVDETTVVHQILEECHRVAETATKILTAHTSGEGVEGERVRNVMPQVAADEEIKTSQMYPKLESVAKEAGIYTKLLKYWFYCL